MASLFPVWLILVVVAAIEACAWLFTPKGPHQTLIRSSIMLTCSVCYILWMTTYLAQLHPLIAPHKILGGSE